MWYGGINPFKTSTFNDSIMRINDRDVVDNVLKELEPKDKRIVAKK